MVFKMLNIIIKYFRGLKIKKKKLNIVEYGF